MSDLLERDAETAAVAKRGDPSPASRPTSDAELVRRFVRTRDEQAFVELERRFGPLVRGVCARALDRTEDREDVYQATFLALFLKAGKIRRRASAACWLYGVAWRIATRLRRKRRLERTELAFDPPADVQEVWVQIDRRHLSQVLDAELQALPTRDRLPLAMHYLMGLSHQEIGRSLGLSASAVDGRLKRARHRLRTRLLSRGVGLASALAYLSTTFEETQAAQAVARGEELYRLFDGGAESPSLSSNAQGLYAEEAGMIATSWSKSAAVFGGVALACGGLVGIFWHGSLGPGVAQAQMGGMGGGFGGGGLGGGDPFAQPPAGPVVTVRMAGEQPAPEKPEDAFFTPLSEPPATKSRLANPAEVDFADTPLGDSLEALAAQADLEVQIDRKALEDRGVAVDELVTLQSNSMTTADALEAILEPLDLTYVAKERYLLVTSRDRAGEMMETRMYAIADHPLLRTADGNAIVNAITGHVAPDSWSMAGGYGSVSLLPGVLIVTNDQRTLDEVEAFLGQYGKLLARYQPAPQYGMESGGYDSGMYGSEGYGMPGAMSPYGESGAAAPGARGVFGAAANPYGGAGGGFFGGYPAGDNEVEEVEEEEAEEALEEEGAAIPADPAAIPGAGAPPQGSGASESGSSPFGGAGGGRRTGGGSIIGGFQ